MPAEENKAVVRKFFEECWNKANLAVLDEIMEPDVPYNDDEHVTRETWRRGLSGWLTAFPDIQYHVDRLVAEGDIVVAKTHFTGTHRGVFRMSSSEPVPPTGKSIDEKEIMFFRLVEGKIVEIWGSWDDSTHVLFAQHLGGDQPRATTTT
jgi:predicted ester cyclase